MQYTDFSNTDEVNSIDDLHDYMRQASKNAPTDGASRALKSHKLFDRIKQSLQFKRAPTARIKAISLITKIKTKTGKIITRHRDPNTGRFTKTPQTTPLKPTTQIKHQQKRTIKPQERTFKFKGHK